MAYPLVIAHGAEIELRTFPARVESHDLTLQSPPRESAAWRGVVLIQNLDSDFKSMQFG